jgi:hypothetical protein
MIDGGLKSMNELRDPGKKCPRTYQSLIKAHQPISVSFINVSMISVSAGGAITCGSLDRDHNNLNKDPVKSNSLNSVRAYGNN